MDKIDAAIARLRTGSLMAERYMGKPMVITYVGCVGCPMAGYVARVNEFARWTKYRQAYLHAFERMLDARRAKGLKSDLWHNADDVMRWWLEDPNVEGQMTMEEIIAEGSEEA